MDQNEDIEYRSYLLNDKDVAANAEAGRVTGSTVETVDFSDVDVVQFTEKRSEQDGMDAGDVFLGARRVNMTGTLYGKTRALLYDEYRAWSAALSPVLAQRESPADKGFRPLYFKMPTADTVNYPDLLIPLQVFALPRAKKVTWARKQQGGKDTDALAIPWAATLLQKDPGIYGRDAQNYALTAGGQIFGNLVNRGTYIARPNIIVTVGATAGAILLQIGGSAMTINVPASSGNRIIRYNGQEKVLTVEENNAENPRFDMLDLGSSEAHPVIPPGTSAYEVAFSTGVTPQVGSRLWFYEAVAG